MPGHFEFEEEQRNGLQLIRWLGEPQIDRWSRDDLWKGSPRFIEDYRVFQSAGLLYPALLGLVWHLTSGLARFALPEFDGVSICERVGCPYELVRWEYGIDWEKPDWRSRDTGFVVAESHRTIPSPRVGAAPNFERFEGAALTPASTWPDLMSIIPAADQANTLCLFAIGPDEAAHARLLAVLRGEQQPGLETVLATDDDVFAVVTQEDEGSGLSSVLIAGRGRLQDSFAAEAARLSDRLSTYLADTAAARTLEDWCAAVDHLADVPTVTD